MASVAPSGWWQQPLEETEHIDADLVIPSALKGVAKIQLPKISEEDTVEELNERIKEIAAIRALLDADMERARKLVEEKAHSAEV